MRFGIHVARQMQVLVQDGCGDNGDPTEASKIQEPLLVAPTQIGITVDAKRGSGSDRSSAAHVCENEGDRGEAGKRAASEAVYYAEKQGLLSKCAAGFSEEGSADP